MPRGWMVMLACAGLLGCEQETSERDEVPADLDAAEPSAAPDPAPPDVGSAKARIPLEPLVRLDATDDPPTPLPAFTAGTRRELVFEVRLAEKKALHVPVVRVRASTAVLERTDDAMRVQWTPQRVDLPRTEGVDEAFLRSFTAALEPGEPPDTFTLTADPWASVVSLPWPAAEDEPVRAVAGGLKLALGHLLVPIPDVGLSKGATWTVQRSVDLFGVTTWERIEAKAQRIDGDQLQVEASVDFVPPAEPGDVVDALGMPTRSIEGKATLVARYDLAAGLPVDMQLKGSLTLRGDAQTKAIRFEVRADENYMAQPDPRVSLEGALTSGGLIIGKAPAGTQVWFNKDELPVSDDGDFVFGFGREAPPRALLAFSFEDGPPIRHILHVESRTFEPEEIDGLPEEYVKLDRETRRALAKSRGRVEKARAKLSKIPHYEDGFAWPARGNITSTYGRKRVLNGEERGPHWGVDIAGRVGKPVKAPAAGVVVFAEQDVPLSGNLVIIDHGHGLTSSFLHLKKIKVQVGDEVKRGQTIATLGNTGRSTGPHLDWRMNLGDTRIDPQLLVPER